ncbi:MAG: HD domain-containing protein [Saprospiraceae bacterium]|nr:HD domain-containing protein [Saprospiraceae bacterium]
MSNILQGQVKFITELEKLKTVQRRNLTLDNKRPENSAEHSWHLALMVPILAPYSKAEIDQLKVIKMLLVHDLGELYEGDTWLYSKADKAETQQKELTAFKQLVATLPRDQQAELIQLFTEFEAQKSNEAKFAKVIDAIQPLLNHLQVSEENENPDEIKASMVWEKKAFVKEYAPDLWSLVEETIRRSVRKGLYQEE